MGEGAGERVGGREREGWRPNLAELDSSIHAARPHWCTSRELIKDTAPVRLVKGQSMQLFYM